MSINKLEDQLYYSGRILKRQHKDSAHTINKRTISNAAIDHAFYGDFQKIQISTEYRFNLTLVTLLILLLPCVYAFIVALSTYGVYYYAINFTVLLTKENIASGLFLYFIPIFSGCLFVLFLWRPLIPKFHRYKSIDLRITEETDPKFVYFVHAVCKKVGAKKPSVIYLSMEANASAALKSFWSLFSNELILTVGFPLVSCMNAQSVAGILAHEFGHFSQTASLRGYYLINVVNRWFYRCIYGNDDWSQWMEKAENKADSAGLGVIFFIVRFGMMQTNNLLSILLRFSRYLTMSLSRQMEFDADKHEIQLVGSSEFEVTARALHRTAAATAMAFNELDYNEDDKYVDNIPSLIRVFYGALPERIDKRIEEQLKDNRLSVWDSHPPDAERIQHAQSLDLQGIFSLDQPAIDLFDSYEEKSKVATQQYYRGQGLNPSSMTFKPVEKTLKSTEKMLSHHSVLHAFCNHWFLPFSVWHIPNLGKASEYKDDKLVAVANKSIASLRSSLPENDMAANIFYTQHKRLMDCQYQFYLKKAGYDVVLPHDQVSMESWRVQVKQDYAAAQKTIHIFNMYLGRRALAAACLMAEGANSQKVRLLITLLQKMKSLEEDVSEARQVYSLLNIVSHHFYQDDLEQFAHVMTSLTSKLEKLNKKIGEVINLMPAKLFDERSGSQILSDRKNKSNVTDNYRPYRILADGDATLTCFYDFNREISSRLASVFTKVEQSFNVKPIKLL